MKLLFENRKRFIFCFAIINAFLGGRMLKKEALLFESYQSDMITQFYVNAKGLDFNTGLATYSAMTAPLYVIMVITPFYKSLADRYGRKLFLALNTYGRRNACLYVGSQSGYLSCRCGYH